jgi:hypothetical protein
LCIYFKYDPKSRSKFAWFHFVSPSLFEWGMNSSPVVCITIYAILMGYFIYGFRLCDFGIP